MRPHDAQPEENATVAGPRAADASPDSRVVFKSRQANPANRLFQQIRRRSVWRLAGDDSTQPPADEAYADILQQYEKP